MFWIIFFGFILVLIRIKDWVFWVSNGIVPTPSYFRFSWEVRCVWKQWRDTSEWAVDFQVPRVPSLPGPWLLLPSGWEMIQIHVTSDSWTCTSEKSWSKYDATFTLNFIAWPRSAWPWDQTDAFDSALLLTNLINLYKVLDVTKLQFLICRMGN